MEIGDGRVGLGRPKVGLIRLFDGSQPAIASDADPTVAGVEQAGFVDPDRATDSKFAGEVAVMPARDGAVLLQIPDLQIQAADRRDDAVAPTPRPTAEYPDPDVMGHVTLTVDTAIGRMTRVDFFD